jgi:hypothetical protein
MGSRRFRDRAAAPAPYLPFVIERERREFQRLRLIQPVDALFNDRSAVILDLGITGALIEHYGEIARGVIAPLRFIWEGRHLEFTTRIMRSTVLRPSAATSTRPLTQSGVRFESAAESSSEQLRDMIATLIGKIISAQRANARGDYSLDVVEGQAILSDLGQARRSRSRGYVSYRLRGKSWWRFPTDSPVQPLDGFTVADYEDEEDLATLCRAYEMCDDEGRRLIRMVAELSSQTVKSARQGPAGRQPPEDSSRMENGALPGR